MQIISNGKGEAVAAEKIHILAAGTIVSTDFGLARRLYEEFLGLDCVQCGPERMLIRDRASKIAMERGDPGYFVIDVRKVDSIQHPQHMLNHWGFSVATTAEVDRIRAEAIRQKEYFGLRKVMPITKIHTSYQFYFSDHDQNWWEIECREQGKTNEMVFEQGDATF